MTRNSATGLTPWDSTKRDSIPQVYPSDLVVLHLTLLDLILSVWIPLDLISQVWIPLDSISQASIPLDSTPLVSAVELVSQWVVESHSLPPLADVHGAQKKSPQPPSPRQLQNSVTQETHFECTRLSASTEERRQDKSP